MTSILSELRLILTYRLLGWALALAPKDMQEGRDVVDTLALIPMTNAKTKRRK